MIDSIIHKETDVTDGDNGDTDAERYSKFMDALKKSGQENVVAMMTNVHKELDLVDKCK